MGIAIEFIWCEHFHWYVMNNIWNDMHPILLKRFSASVLSLTTSIVGKLQRQQWWPMEAMDRRPFCYRMRKSNVKLWLMVVAFANPDMAKATALIRAPMHVKSSFRNATNAACANS